MKHTAALQALVVVDCDPEDGDPAMDDKRSITELDEIIHQLTAENQRLKTRLAELEPRERYDDGSFTMAHFLTALAVKRHQTYGWRIDYITATHDTPDCQPVSNETIQRWQTSDRVPGWAIEQIARLAFKKRSSISSPAWSKAEESFLLSLYADDPMRKNAEIARLCSEKFGRPISENAIKGAIDRARKKNLLPWKRRSQQTQQAD